MVNNLIKINLKSNSAVKQLQMMNKYKILLVTICLSFTNAFLYVTSSSSSFFKSIATSTYRAVSSLLCHGTYEKKFYIQRILHFFLLLDNLSFI